MAAEGSDVQQQKVNEFMKLLPLTVTIAGLPESEHGKYYNEGQLEARVTTLKAAYKLARQVVLDIAR